jgi:hypothetical protein
MRGSNPCCPDRVLIEELTQDESSYALAISTTGTWLGRSRRLFCAHAFGFKNLELRDPEVLNDPNRISVSSCSSYPQHESF